MEIRNHSHLESENFYRKRSTDLTNRPDDVRLVSAPVGPCPQHLIERKMIRHINELKTALEFARFASPDIRDAVSTCIKHIAADMEEVEYEDSVATAQAFKALAGCIAEFENPNGEVTAASDNSDEDEHEVDRETPVEFDIDDEIEHVIKKPSTSDESDDDDIEA